MQSGKLKPTRIQLTAAAFAAAVIAFAPPVYSPLVPGLRVDGLIDAKARIGNKDKSVMPENLERAMTEQEFRDLLAFLQSLK